MRKLFLFFGIILAGIGTFYLALGDGLLHVTFLDVGQGDSVLVRTPRGQNILIDGGPDWAVVTRLAEELPFGEATLDYVVLTHADADHLAGLNYIFRRYRVGTLLTSANFSETLTYERFLREIQTENIPVQVIDAGNDFVFEPGVSWDTLYPLEKTFTKNTNNNAQSVVGRLSYGANSFLLTGDLDTEGEKNILAQGFDVRSDLLKLAHHGSNTGNSALFLQTVQPRWAVVSVGANNSFGHPRAEVLARCAELQIPLVRTDTQGSLHFISDGQALQYLP